jgi:hypothetical protein
MRWTGAHPGIVLAMHLIASAQQPIDLPDTATAGVDPHNCAPAFRFVKFQNLFGSFEHGLQGCIQLGFAIKQAFDHNLLIAGADHIRFLSTPPIALFGKIAFAGKLGFLPHGRPVISASNTCQSNW